MSVSDQSGAGAGVVVVGAGAGGICAAIAAARAGAPVVLIERDEQVGGTGVHSPVGLICQFYDKSGRAINEGLHRELVPRGYEWSGRFNPDDIVPNYDERELLACYQRLLAAEPRIQVLTGCEVVAATREGGRIAAVELADGRRIAGQAFIDGTADGNLAALAGAEWQKGRTGDSRMQTATLTFKIAGIDPSRLAEPDIRTWRGIRSLRAELLPYFQALLASGRTDNLRRSILCFPYDDGRSILLNSTAVADVDPTDPESLQRGMDVGQAQVEALAGALLQHPALAQARVEFVSKKLGIREGRRVMGDYLLTVDDVMGEARFDDMVAACAYGIDIHDPQGAPGGVRNIPGSGYYHIPYRSLRARPLENLLLGSRCISGTHEAHSSYRVIAGVTAIGQAAGAAAALAAGRGGRVRAVDAEEIRWVLAAQGQFVEGRRRPPQAAS